jgi:hypothetical protein
MNGHNPRAPGRRYVVSSSPVYAILRLSSCPIISGTVYFRAVEYISSRNREKRYKSFILLSHNCTEPHGYDTQLPDTVADVLKFIVCQRGCAELPLRNPRAGNAGARQTMRQVKPGVGQSAARIFRTIRTGRQKISLLDSIKCASGHSRAAVQLLTASGHLRLLRVGKPVGPAGQPRCSDCVAHALLLPIRSVSEVFGTRHAVFSSFQIVRDRCR